MLACRHRCSSAAPGSADACEFGLGACACFGVDAFLAALSGAFVLGEFDAADPEFVGSALEYGACAFGASFLFRHSHQLYSIRVSNCTLLGLSVVDSQTTVLYVRVRRRALPASLLLWERLPSRRNRHSLHAALRVPPTSATSMAVMVHPR
jgi:hypothetical protein